MKKLTYKILLGSAVLSLCGCGKEAVSSVQSGQTESVITESSVSQPETEQSAIKESNQTAEKNDEVLDKLLQDWTSLLLREERRYSQENDTLEKIMDMAEDGTWESYLYAMTSCFYTTELIKAYSESEIQPVMTAADYQEVAERGMDLGDIQGEIQIYNEYTVPELAEKEYPIWKNYLDRLLYSSYDENELSELVNSAQLRYQHNVEMMKNLYLVNNFIMLELPEDYAEKLLEITELEMPNVMGCYDQAFPTTEAVLNEMNDILMKIEESTLQLDEALTREYILLEDYETVPRKIEGMPTMLRFPESVAVNDWEVQCYWKKGEEIQTPDYLMEMTEVPNCMHMMQKDVPLEAYQRYVLELKDMGIMPEVLEEESALYTFDDGTKLFIYLEEQELHIAVNGGQIAFVPLWYLNVVQ